MRLTVNISFLALLAFLFSMNFAHAIEDAKAPVLTMGQGIAMHGSPKYGPDAAQLDYVNTDAPKGGAFKQAAIGSFDSLNPFALKGKAAQGLGLAYDRLMQRVWDEPFTMYPLIAERADMPEDRSSITFTLNPAARFNDGTPITVDDVLFSFETLRDSGRPNMRRVYQLASEAKITGPRSIRFTFGEGADRETPMIFALMPVLSKAYWSGKTFDKSTLEVPVSSGPYKIGAFEPGRSITYERDVNYWAKDLPVNRGQFNFDRLTYDYYRDDTVALESFLKGNLDMRREYDITKWQQGYRDSDRYKKVAFKHERPVRIDSLIFNTRRAPFDDIRVRKALNLAFDGAWVNKNLYFSRMKRIGSFFENSYLAAPKAPDIWQPPASDTREDMRENLIEADRLLTEAGWHVRNGLRANDEGTAFTFEILVSAKDQEKLALNFARNLRKLGVAARVRVLDAAAFLDRMMGYDFDMAYNFWQSSLSPGTEQYLYWSCEAANQEGRFNYAGICDPEIDTLALNVPKAHTKEELEATVHTLDAALLNQVPTVPLFYTDADLIAVSKTVAYPDKSPIYGAILESWWSAKGN
ncbi:MAG: extracellular solute-binding protein [Pseudobdellovibrionaceae bacterium]